MPSFFKSSEKQIKLYLRRRRDESIYLRVLESREFLVKVLHERTSCLLDMIKQSDYLLVMPEKRELTMDHRMQKRHRQQCSGHGKWEKMSEHGIKCTSLPAIAEIFAESMGWKRESNPVAHVAFMACHCQA